MNCFGIVGCGKMGQALLAGMLPELKDTPVICCDVSEDALKAAQNIVGGRATVTHDLNEVASKADVVLLCVKPAQALGVVKRLNDGPRKVIFSIVAGLSHAKLSGCAPAHICVRVMPNTPALVGAGTSVIYDSGLPQPVRELAERLFSRAGGCYFVDHEEMMDAVTGLSGSTPALFAMMIEALADAGVAEGLPRATALALARETMLGTAKLLEHQHPAILKENVMSPGGTTAAGVLAAEKAGFRQAAAAFVCAAAKKSREMA